LRPGRELAGALQRASLCFDFGVFVVAPSDQRIARTASGWAALDNVILEFGIFMGVSRLNTAFLVIPGTGAADLPADLRGVIHIPYDAAAPDIDAEFEGVARTITRSIQECLRDSS
jgi:predicted nucleotide-binding protein